MLSLVAMPCLPLELGHTPVLVDLRGTWNPSVTQRRFLPPRSST